MDHEGGHRDPSPPAKPENSSDSEPGEIWSGLNLANPGRLSYDMAQMTHTATLEPAPAKSTERVQRVQAILGLTQAELAEILELSPKTLARRPLNANETDRLQILEQFISLAATLVPEEHLAGWFSESKVYLDGASPKTLLVTERGRRVLETYLLGLIDSNVL